MSLALLVVGVIDHGSFSIDCSGATPNSSGLLRLGRDPDATIRQRQHGGRWYARGSTARTCRPWSEEGVRSFLLFLGDDFQYEWGRYRSVLVGVRKVRAADYSFLTRRRCRARPFEPSPWTVAELHAVRPDCGALGVRSATRVEDLPISRDRPRRTPAACSWASTLGRLGEPPMTGVASETAARVDRCPIKTPRA